MREKNSSPVFMISLILSILIMVAIIAFVAKKDTEEVQQVQQQISTGESTAADFSDVIQDYNDGIQSEYDALEEGLK